MTLRQGSRVGPYEIVGELGAGGMGVVYRAIDTRLNRPTAVKSLPAHFASEPDRLARFQREAELLASLNHPNLAGIYGIEEAADVRVLAMELVEGPTLAERIEQGPLSLDDALAIAKQLAEALEYAHERGIIHRDLKPANIKITPEGQVKVLDFGLAKAVAGEASASSPTANSPTLSLAATQAGLILGTAGYMSPEQAKGKPADRRADIWAFGIVVYEMLAGRQAYTGETASETMAHVITKEPDWTALPAQVPHRLRELLQRCLVKDPRNRVRDIGDVRLTIEELISGGDQAASDVITVAPASTVPRWRTLLPWTITAMLALALGAAIWNTMRPGSPQPITRMSVDVAGNGSLVTTLGAAAVLSPDGRSMVLRVSVDGTAPHLVLRRLDRLNGVTLNGTEGARDPFFSPDGRWIGFFDDAKLKKVPVDGGGVVTLCDAQSSRGGSWNTDDTIVFAPTAGSPLMRVAAAGGTPEALTRLEQGESGHRYPQVLPGGDAVLFTVMMAGLTAENSKLVAQSLRTGERTVVRNGAYYGRYAPSGHLLFFTQSALFAAPFDVGRLTTGDAVPVVEGVTNFPSAATAQYAFSETGTLAYVAGSQATGVGIYWAGRDGKALPLREVRADYYSPRFSPDGRRLAIDIRTPQSDIWIYEWETDRMTRLTFGEGMDFYPVWSLDGTRIAYASGMPGTANNLFWQRADGAGEAQRLTEGPLAQRPMSFHPSGKYLALEQRSEKDAGSDIAILPIDGDEKNGWKPGKPQIFLATPANETEPAFSPDGRWLAYQSNESGLFEIYVRPFPGPGGKWQISTAGGVLPTWVPKTSQLLYRTVAGDAQILASTYSVEGDSFRAARPQVWSAGAISDRGPNRNFDIHPDGQRLAILKATESGTEGPRNHVVLVLNFFDELRRLAPRTKN